jgi:hypothetical protein
MNIQVRALRLRTEPGRWNNVLRAAEELVRRWHHVAQRCPKPDSGSVAGFVEGLQPIVF